MIITKKQSKNLRYFARANYKSECKGVESENGKVKHREFPCFELAYDEAKADAGNVELTNVTIGGKPFDGDYDALMARLRVLLDSPDDICAEELEQDKTLTEQAMDAVKDKSDAIVIAEKPGDILKETLKDCFPEGSEISVDVKPEENRIDANVFIPNPVDHIDAKIEVKPVEEPLGVLHLPRGLIKNESECLEALTPSYENYPPQEPEKKTVIVTGPACDERHGSGRDFSGLSLETIDEVFASVIRESKGDMKPSDEPPPLEEQSSQELPIVEDVEEAKKVAEETGTPVITAEQKPKKTRAELYDLQIKCATMRLATSYGEPPETDIGSLMKKYPDAVEKLNALYAADGIKTYTITEDAIKQAYPDEYAALC